MTTKTVFKLNGAHIALLALMAAAMFFAQAAAALMLLLPLFLSWEAGRTDSDMLLPAGLFIPLLIAFRYQTPLLLTLGLTGLGLLPALAVFADRRFNPAFSQRLLGYFAALLLGLTGFLPFLNQWAGPDIIAGLAQRLTDALSTAPMRDDLLIRLYNYGYVGITKQMLSSQRVLSGIAGLLGREATALLPEVREEMLKSLYTTLKIALPNLLPSFMAVYAGGGAVLSAMLPVVARRRRGEDVQAPPFTQWHLKGAWLGLAYMLALGFAVPMFFADRSLIMTGGMMTALFKVIMVTLGLSSIAFTQKKAGVNRGTRLLWAVGLTVLFHQIPLFIGIFDHIMNLRGLRPKNKEDAQ